MKKEFIDSVINAQFCALERPQIQQQARAITLSVPPLSRRETQGDLPYPYPGKGVSGETTN
jgi:hypothetical protein